MGVLEFSEQQLVDCAGGEYLNEGCNGGMEYWAYNYLRNTTLEFEQWYPYAGVDQTCSYNPDGGVTGTKVRAYTFVTDFGTGGERSAINAAIATTPSNVSLAAGNDYFRSYESGILSSDECPTDCDHALLAVGYG